MKELIFGTKNSAKIEQIQGVLTPLGIKVRGINGFANLPEVQEDGATAGENARKKALTFAKAIGQNVFSMDNALYLDGFADCDQPGTHVRRIGVHEDRVTDEMMLKYYSELIASHGGKVSGHWEFAVALASPDGNVFEALFLSPRQFTSRISPKVLEGYPLDSLQVDSESGHYISEMTEAERAKFWQRAIGDQLCAFIARLDSERITKK